ncbi:Uncharacterised protein [Vibrio cholerae]|nr:Uncharacterised protein [Vibrio cholerae]
MDCQHVASSVRLASVITVVNVECGCVLSAP